MYKFTKDDGQRVISMEVKDEYISWPSLVEEFQNFLLACGYSFPKNLDFSATLTAEKDMLMENEDDRED